MFIAPSTPRISAAAAGGPTPEESHVYRKYAIHIFPPPQAAPPPHPRQQRRSRSPKPIPYGQPVPEQFAPYRLPEPEPFSPFPNSKFPYRKLEPEPFFPLYSHTTKRTHYFKHYQYNSHGKEEKNRWPYRSLCPASKNGCRAQSKRVRSLAHSHDARPESRVPRCCHGGRPGLPLLGPSCRAVR